MSEAAVVRLFHFQPVRSAFDTVLRDVLLPDLRAMPGATRAWAGRQGPSEVGTRLIVSVWTSRTAMRAALGDDAEDARSHPAQLEAITDRRLEVHPLVWMGSAEAPLTTGILRVTRGTLSSGDVATYEELLLHDVAAWRKEGKGPRAVILASRGPREILMISTWPDWAAIEEASGASVEDPLRVKRDRLREFHVDHYELVDDQL